MYTYNGIFVWTLCLCHYISVVFGKREVTPSSLFWRISSLKEFLLDEISDVTSHLMNTSDSCSCQVEDLFNHPGVYRLAKTCHLIDKGKSYKVSKNIANSGLFTKQEKSLSGKLLLTNIQITELRWQKPWIGMYGFLGIRSITDLDRWNF